MQSLRSAMIARVRRPVAARRSVSEAPAAAVPPRMQVGVVNQAVSRLRTVGLGFLGGVVAAFAVYEYWKKPAAAAAAGHSATALDAETKNTAKQLTSALGRIEALEKELRTVREGVASRKELDGLKAQIATQKDALEIALAQHKAAVWEGQEELYKVLAQLDKRTQPPAQ